MSNLKNLIESYPSYSSIMSHFKFSEKLAPYTSFKIGGDAEVLYTPYDVIELKELCDFLIKNKVDISVIGNASNLLISDAGLLGVVFHFSKLHNISILKEEDDIVLLKVQAGVLMDDLLQFCIKESLSGLENFGGLPASIGGAVFMNAKCFNSSMADLISSVDYVQISKEGAVFGEYKMKMSEWSYKSSPFQENTWGIRALDGRKIILSCTFKLKKGSREEIKTKIEERYKERMQKRQFECPSAGSVFKNDYNLGIPTGKLVSESGLLGFAKNKAEIAPWHGNFIINRGGASSSDVLYIMQVVRTEVQKKYGILLEPEIIYCE